jgi:hypothetical protein
MNDKTLAETLREFCPSCERYVRGVHSCYDAAQLRALADADRAVVEAASEFRLHATDARTRREDPA